MGDFLFCDTQIYPNLMPHFIINTLLAVFIITFSSCSKEEDTPIIEEAGVGGNAWINGHVMHHDDAIVNAIVYIKYGATELPGIDPSLYDDHDTSSASDAHYNFNDLKKGNYYLFATGYDSSCACDVFGGTPTKIVSDMETVEINVPVTE